MSSGSSLGNVEHDGNKDRDLDRYKYNTIPLDHVKYIIDLKLEEVFVEIHTHFWTSVISEEEKSESIENCFNI